MIIKNDLTDFEDIKQVDFWDICNYIRQFYFHLDLDFDESDETRISLIEARGFLDSALILLKNKIEKENIYIKEKENIKYYEWMLDNLGRAEKRLDQIEKDTIQQIENARVLNVDVSKSAKIMVYAKNLNLYMDHFIYYPIKNGYKRFILFRGENDGKAIKKDSNLLLWFVFLELFQSSEILGALTREESKSVPKNYGVSNTNPTSSPNANPPEIPSNVQTENKDDFEDFEEL